MDKLNALVHNLTILRSKEEFSTATGSLFIRGQRCIGIREIVRHLFPDHYTKLVPEDRVKLYAEVVYESPVVNDSHSHFSAAIASLASQLISPIFLEYPVGTRDLCIDLHGEVVTPVGLVDIVGMQNNHTTVIEIKTADIEAAPRLQYLSLYQVYGYRKLICASSEHIHRVEMYVVGRSNTKVIMWKVKAVPNKAAYDKAFKIVVQ